jgi:hypothetical protein
LYLSANGGGEADLRGDAANSSAPDDASAPVLLSPSCSPNPFGQGTAIAFTLQREGPVRITVYDVAGRLVRVLAEGRMQSGRHEIPWDGRASNGHSASSGAYWIRLTAGGREVVTRVVRVE